MGEGRNVYRVGKPEGKRPLEGPRRRWEDGIKIGLSEIGWGRCGMDSPGSGQGSLAGCCECGDESSDSGTTDLVSYYICSGNYQAHMNNVISDTTFNKEFYAKVAYKKFVIGIAGRLTITVTNLI
jgi:hypothetical protein